MSDYTWPFIGALTEPIVAISKRQFVGPGKVYPPDAPEVRYQAPQLNVRLGEPEPLGYQGYRVVRAFRHRGALQRHVRYPAAPHTDGGLVLLTADGTPCGRTLFNHVHLEPGHRSGELGAELIAAFEVVFPAVLIAYAFKAPQRTYTEAGKHTIELAYDLLSGRGAVTSGA